MSYVLNDKDRDALARGNFYRVSVIGVDPFYVRTLRDVGQDMARQNVDLGGAVAYDLVDGVRLPVVGNRYTQRLESPYDRAGGLVRGELYLVPPTGGYPDTTRGRFVGLSRLGFGVVAVRFAIDGGERITINAAETWKFHNAF
jgi:hypothetical protein